MPKLSDFVDDGIWRIISEDLLESEDQTDGGPPNDDAVEDFLRMEGNYAEGDGQMGKMMHSGVLEAFESIRWPLKATNMAGFENYMMQ